MQWPLRNQIFVPFAFLLVLSVSLVAVVAAWSASAQSRQQTLDHTDAVAAALGDAQFPLTQDIAERIAAMVAGDVIVADPRGQIKASTLPVETLPEQLRPLAESDVQRTEEVELFEQAYIVTVIPRRRVPRPGPLFVLMPQENLQLLRREAMLPMLYVAAPTLLVALVMALFIAGGMAGRVNRLRLLFSNLSQGQYQRVDVSGRHDELRDLLCSANDLSVRLEQLQTELRRSDRLQLLSQLSGGLAHQLRNSIAGAKMAVQLHQQSQPAAAPLLETAMSQLRLTEEQVLAVLSLRDGGPQESARVVCLNDLIQDVHDLLRPQSLHWKTDVRVEAPSERVSVVLQSAASLRGAVLNIVLNAMEATGTDGIVVIQLARKEDRVMLEVRDNGPGFSFATDDLTDVFRTTKPEGIGLGLTIAEHAVCQENGVLQIAREERWTCVRIRLAPALPTELTQSTVPTVSEVTT